MAFLDTTLAKAAFKKAFGKTHTGNAKDLGNESVASEFTVASTSVFGEAVVYNSPSASVTAGVAVDCTNSNSLNLVLDVTSNNKAYFAQVPTGSPLLSYINPLTGVNFVAGDRVTRIIPQKFGDNYRIILKNNNGVTEIPPLDASDWFCDEVAGVITSEDNLSLTNGRLACYIYVGKMLDEVIEEVKAMAGGGSGGGSLQNAYNNGGTIDLDGYYNLSIHSETDGYGLSVNVQGANDISSHLDGTFHSDGYINISSDKTIKLSDEYITDMRLTNSAESYSGISGTTLLTTRKSLIGAINEAFLSGSSGGGASSERGIFVLSSPIPMSSGLDLTTTTYGTVELAPPEGLGFSFQKDVFVYLNGSLLVGDSLSYETNGSVVVNEVALNAAGTRIYFYYDLKTNDNVQIYNINGQVI